MIEPNNIYLGDCYELIKEIPDKSIDLIYMDIPYEFVAGGKGGAFGAKKKSYNNDIMVSDQKRLLKQKETMKNLKHGTREYEKVRKEYGRIKSRLDTSDINSGIDYAILDELCRVMKYIYIYIWCSKLQITYLFKYFVEERDCNFDVLVWCKTNPIPKTNNSYLPDVEYCLFFREKNCPKHLNDGYELKSKWWLSSANVDDKHKYEHPTIKPIELVKRHIRHSTNEGDIVLDPFVGSGTTCKACQELNRQYIGFEINPRYYQIAVDRMNNINVKGEISLF